MTRNKPVWAFLATLLTASTAAAEPPVRVHLAGRLMAAAWRYQDETTVSVNLLPVVGEVALSPWIGLRANTIVELKLSGPQSGHTGIGLGFTLPFYLLGSPTRTLHVGPHFAVTHDPNAPLGPSEWTVSGEAGIRWPLASSWTFNITGEAGASRFEEDHSSFWGGESGPFEITWVPRFGVFLGLGYWWGGS